MIRSHVHLDLELPAELEISIASSKEDLKSAFKLLYEAYVDADSLRKDRLRF